MDIALRPARSADFEFCRRVYFAEMENIIQALGLDREKQARGFGAQWILSEVEIIVFGGADAGWLQTKIDVDEIFLAQLFIDGSLQRRGIGTEVMNRLLTRAKDLNKTVALAVVKINPALRLYERFGFQIVHEDEHKFYMRRDASAAIS